VEHKRNLLVTLADKNFIQQAKQLFSSVYWNAGWDGDYMLLAHDVPEEGLEWFRSKGIYIKKCTPLHDNNIGINQHHPIVLDKFYLFSPEFKKWNNIVFLDADIIVKGSLKRLTNINGFGAVSGAIHLEKHFFIEAPLFKEIESKYSNKANAFCSGVLVFSTNIIQNDTLTILMGLYERYKSILHFNEEGILNLFFYKKWINLPVVFGLNVTGYTNGKINYNKKAVRGIVLHFIAKNNKEPYKPWNPVNPFYSEWISNCKRAELINVTQIQKVKSWNAFIIIYNSLMMRIYCFKGLVLIRLRDFYYYVKDKILIRIKWLFLYKIFIELKLFCCYLANTPESLIGKIGAAIKLFSPGLYNKLKNRK
jgi:lipopolysaccharide biosynthesis glycosyltransferase